jgi:S-adenosylmethionine-diacylglycerol 3-amino-3-carboxypropyl transferase
LGSKYFHELNYSLANEDTGVELELLPKKANRVLVIPSSGAQALPLLAKNPRHLHIVDISLPQLFITELRLSALKNLEYDEWLYFMGYRKFSSGLNRREIFSSLHLSPSCREYWLQDQLSWEKMGFIWLGRWERFFKNLGNVSRPLFLTNFNKFFEEEDLIKQRQIYERFWPHRRFSVFLKIASSPEFMNHWLYQGHYAGTPKRTWKHIEERYRSIFFNHIARKNFFMQMLFLGEIKYEEAFPAEAQREIFNLAKLAETEIKYIHDNILNVITQRPYDFYHLSDVLSYLPSDEAVGILSRMHPDVKAGALVIARLFNRGPGELAHPGWSSEKDLELWAQRRDETAVYDFRIARRN